MPVDAGNDPGVEGGTILLYGSYGYTGDLIAEECRKKGLNTILGGRDEQKLNKQSGKYGFSYRCFSLDDPEEILRNLEGIDAVLNCAGPFIYTAEKMSTACMEAGVHYLDITGEFEIFEMLAGNGLQANKKGIVLLPGVGFDVVPSDCLARFGWERLQSAIKMRMFISMSGGASYGSASTVIEHSCNGGAVRRRGIICRVRPAHKRAVKSFNGTKRKTVTIPWGDVSTAYHSTGVADIEVYMAMPSSAILMMRASRLFRSVFKKDWAKKFIKAFAGKPGSGPNAEARSKGSTHILLELNGLDSRKSFEFTGPDGYSLTAKVAADAAARVLKGEVKPGFRTPSSAFGAEYILEFEGTNMRELS